MVEYLNVCIVDSSVSWRNTAKCELRRALEPYGVGAYVDGISTPEKLKKMSMQELRYDMILADISDTETRTANLRLFAEVQRESPQTRLVLVSSDLLAALDVFDYSPDYFIYKPELNMRMNQAIRHIYGISKKQTESDLVISANSTNYIIPTERILYIERCLHDTIIVCEDREILCHDKLSELMEQLDERRFLRCHCSFLINAEQVTQFNRKQVILKNGKCIPCSRANYQATKYSLEQWHKHEK